MCAENEYSSMCNCKAGQLYAPPHRRRAAQRHTHVGHVCVLTSADAAVPARLGAPGVRSRAGVRPGEPCSVLCAGGGGGARRALGQKLREHAEAVARSKGGVEEAAAPQ